MSNPTDSLPPGVVQFFDSFEPGLKDATYRIDATQTVSAPNATIAPLSQTFIIEGPRFALDPSEIHARFPPNGTSGTFGEVLAHVVLNKRLLPWERDIPGLGTAVPWLALLVFQEGELLGEAGGGNYARTLTVGELLASDPSGTVRKPTLTNVSDADRALSCQAITLRSALFAQIVPTGRELPYLAHARQVNTGSMANFGLKDDGWFSVVVANRFPRPGVTTPAKNVVHLVSLEGFGDLLSGNAPVAPNESQVQLVSLASWTFSCEADPTTTFAGLAESLARDGNAVRPASSLLLRLPGAATAKTDPGFAAAALRLNDGYVALGWRAPSGEDGFAWYRGPLTPVVTNTVPGAAAFETSDAAMIYDPATGVFDHSLAAAWQAGRALALANQPFATALMRLRTKANTVLERLSAPAAPDIHAQLAALFANGAAEAIRAASKSGRAAQVARPLRAAPRQSPVASLRTLLDQPAVQDALAASVTDDPDAKAVAAWLGELLLLRPVPFVHLVPDARMLPAESIRFFYLDPNWTGALVDGALSVGIGTSRESAVHDALTPVLEQMARTAACAWRARQSGQPPLPEADGPTSGFLLRSALASGWPGFGVTGTHAGAPVPLLRMEHLAPGVLFALFNGVPDTVTLSEPHEGLEFGVDDAGQIETRTITPPTVTPGPPLTVYRRGDPGAAPAATRAGGQRVLNIASDPTPAVQKDPVDLLELIAQKLNVSVSTISPARFAVQMVKGPEQIQFTLSSPPRPA